jgi:hypothetical protein
MHVLSARIIGSLEIGCGIKEKKNEPCPEIIFNS